MRSVLSSYRESLARLSLLWKRLAGVGKNPKRARSFLCTISLAERTWCLSLNERVSLESAPAVLEGASWQNCDEFAKLHSKRGGPGKAQGLFSTSPATLLAPLSENEPVRF